MIIEHNLVIGVYKWAQNSNLCNQIAVIFFKEHQFESKLALHPDHEYHMHFIMQVRGPYHKFYFSHEHILTEDSSKYILPYSLQCVRSVYLSVWHSGPAAEHILSDTDGGLAAAGLCSLHDRV